MRRCKSFVICLMIYVLVLPHKVLAVGELSEQDWLNMFQLKIDSATDTFYMLTSKVYTDGALTLIRNGQYGVVNLMVLRERLKQLELQMLSGNSAEKAGALRQVLIAKEQVDYLSSEIKYQHELWKGFRTLQANQCTADYLKTYSMDAKVPAVLQIDKVLKGVNDQIDYILKQDIDVYSFEINYTFNIDGEQNGLNNFGTSVVYDNEENVSRAITAGFSMVCAALATIIFPGLGTLLGGLIGSAIGAVVGGIITWIIFGSKKSQWVNVAREQGERAKNAASQLDNQGIVSQVSGSCERMVGSSLLKELYQKVDQTFVKVMAEAEALTKDVQDKLTSIQTTYAAELNRLQELFPLAKEVAAQNFEKYFVQIQNLSSDSALFTKDRLVPALTQVHLPGRSRLTNDAEQELWEGLIEGEVKFSRFKNFSFTLAASEEIPPPDPIYWDAAVKSIMKSLRPKTGDSK